MQAINFEKVGFSYNYNDQDDARVKRVLNGLDFTVEKGAFVALLGKNGSGKSTLAKLINGLIKPTEGKVTVLGMDTSDKTALFEIRKRVGMVFQNPDNQQIASIVEDDIAFGPENIGMERAEIKKSIDLALKTVDMEKYRNHQISRLSGGQKQRIAIAGAIVINPEILILDESTSMLDPKGRREVMEVARNLNKEKGMTVIDITHYMDEAVDADRIYVLDEGGIALQGTPSEVFARTDVLERAGLDLPRPSVIANKLREEGVDLGGNILTKEDLSEKLCELLQKI